MVQGDEIADGFAAAVVRGATTTLLATGNGGSRGQRA